MTRRLFALLTALWMLPCLAHAHALDPGYLELARLGDENWRVIWRVPDVSGRPMPLAVNLSETCTSPPTMVPSFDGRAWLSGWIATCPDGLAGGTIHIEGLDQTATDVLVRYELIPGAPRIHRLTPGTAGFVVPDRAGIPEVLASYVSLGFTHILEGADHLLFVFALLLLVPTYKRLFGAVTAFTVAHSLTLAAATLGVLRIPPPPVEAVIALSIVFLAYELCLPPDRRDPLALRAPWLVSFSFGLIHGLGFSGALREIGLPEADIPLALLSFNIGVELGQLAFIAVVLSLATALCRILPVLVTRAEPLMRGTGYVIGTISAFWVIERVSGF